MIKKLLDHLTLKRLNKLNDKFITKGKGEISNIKSMMNGIRVKIDKLKLPTHKKELKLYVEDLNKEFERYITMFDNMVVKFNENDNTLQNSNGHDIAFERRFYNAMNVIKNKLTIIENKLIRCDKVDDLKWFEIFKYEFDYHYSFDSMKTFDEYSKKSLSELLEIADDIFKNVHVPSMELKTDTVYYKWLDDLHVNLIKQLNKNMFFFYDKNEDYEKLIQRIIRFCLERNKEHVLYDWCGTKYDIPMIVNRSMDALELYIILMCCHNIVFENYINFSDDEEL